MLNDKMVNAMKRNYIIPSTVTVAIQSGFVCQVGSVQGGTLGFGGEQDSIDPN